MVMIIIPPVLNAKCCDFFLVAIFSQTHLLRLFHGKRCGKVVVGFCAKRSLWFCFV